MIKLENAAIRFWILTFLTIFITGIRISYDAGKIITDASRLRYEKRKSLYLLELIFNIFRFTGTLRVLYQRKLEYAFNVHFLNMYFIVLCLSELIINDGLIFFIIISFFLHLLYAFLFQKIFYHAKEIFLVKSLREIGCGVQKMRMFMVRKKLIVQRRLIYFIIFLRELTLYVYDEKQDNRLFFFLPLIVFVLTRFEIYEVRITKMITILFWFIHSSATTYLIMQKGGSNEHLSELRLFMFAMIIYVHVIYNILDLFFYGYGINKLL